jgi:hypothetical protein
MKRLIAEKRELRKLKEEFLKAQGSEEDDSSSQPVD